MNKATYPSDYVCPECRHQLVSNEYRPECPICCGPDPEAGFLMEEVHMECGECGAAWSDVDMENAQDAFRWYNEFWGHLNWWERIKAVWGMRGFPRNGTEHEFKFTGSSRRHWNYGTESEDWTEFYECSCGERLDYDNGWSLQA